MIKDKRERKKDTKLKEKLMIEQGGLDPITKEKLVQINQNRKKIEISDYTENAHIEGFAENSRRYNPKKNSEVDSNIIAIRIDNHRNIDVSNPENYSVKELKKRKNEIKNETSDEEVYKKVRSCDCSYVKRYKKVKKYIYYTY